MLSVFDIIENASDLKAPPEGVRLMGEAREAFKEEFARRFPGFGKGRAVW